MNRIFAIALLGLAGCAHSPLNCVEACAFENMKCSGASLTQPSAKYEQIDKTHARVVMDAKRTHQCVPDDSKQDEFAKIRNDVIKRERPN